MGVFRVQFAGQVVRTKLRVIPLYFRAMEEEIMKTPVADHDDDSGHASESDDDKELLYEAKILARDPYPMQIVWPNIVKFIILHSLALYGLTFLPTVSWQSWIFLLASYQFSGAGITAGAHRLWSHKTYKAKYPLRLFLAIANSMAGGELYLCLDKRPPHSPQVQRDCGGPSQCHQGVLLCPHGVAAGQEAPGGDQGREDNQHV